MSSLVLIAQAVFLLERGRKDRQTGSTDHFTHACGYASVGNYGVILDHYNWKAITNYLNSMTKMRVTTS